LIAGLNAGAWHWTVASGQAEELVGVGASDVRSVALSADGSLAATGDARGQVTLWTTEDGNAVRRLRGHEGPVLAMLFDTDRRRLITAGADSTVRIWSMDSGDDIAVLRGHEGPVVKLRISDEGRRLASASEDGTVRVWGYGPDALRELVRGRLPRGLSEADLPARLSQAEAEELLRGAGRR
jgi:WD40 repeat protein